MCTRAVFIDPSSLNKEAVNSVGIFNAGVKMIDTRIYRKNKYDPGSKVHGMSYT